MLLVRHDFFVDFGDLAAEFGICLLHLIDVIRQVFDLLLHAAHIFFGLVRLGLKVHLELLILLFVFLERLFALVQLVLLHDDVLSEQFSLLRLLVNRNLGHQDLARVVYEVSHGLFLLTSLVQILIWVRFWRLT